MWTCIVRRVFESYFDLAIPRYKKLLNSRFGDVVLLCWGQHINYQPNWPAANKSQSACHPIIIYLSHLKWQWSAQKKYSTPLIQSRVMQNHTGEWKCLLEAKSIKNHKLNVLKMCVKFTQQCFDIFFIVCDIQFAVPCHHRMY